MSKIADLLDEYVEKIGYQAGYEARAKILAHVEGLENALKRLASCEAIVLSGVVSPEAKARMIIAEKALKGGE